MRLVLKEYQHRTLEAFIRWLGALDVARSESQRRAAALEGVGLEASKDDRNFPSAAWDRLVAAGGIESGAREHMDRYDEAHKAYGGKGATEFVRAVDRLAPRDYPAPRGGRGPDRAPGRTGLHRQAQRRRHPIRPGGERAQLQNAGGHTKGRFWIMFREESFGEVMA